jgi:cell division transport system permease protein
MIRLLAFLKTYLLHHLQTAFSSLGKLWESPISNSLTSLAIGIALALPACLFILLFNFTQVSSQWQDGSQISLFLQQSLSDNKAKSLDKKLNTWPEISTTNYQTAAESLAEFKQRFGMDDLLDVLPDNPLPAVILVELKDEVQTEKINTLLKKLNALPAVEHAQFDMAWLQRLRNLNKIGSRGIMLLGILLSLSVLLIIGNTIRLTIINRKDEISIIKLIGGTNSFIRRPFLYTGFWYGIFGGFIAWLILLIVFYLLDSPVNNLAGLYGSQFTLQWYTLLSFFILPFLGALLGIIGAGFTVHQQIKEIEPK